MVCPKAFFARQLVDEIGFHAVRLQKIIMLLFMLQIILTILTGSWLSSLLYTGVLFMGFYGALKRKTCLLKIYSCIHIFLFILAVIGLIFGTVMYFHFKNTVCDRVGAPTNSSSNIYAVWEGLVIEDPMTTAPSTQVPIEISPLPIEVGTETPVEPGTEAPIAGTEVEALNIDSQRNHNDDDDDHEHKHKHHKNKHHKDHKNKEHKEKEEDEEEDDSSLCWEYPESPHCENEWKQSSFLGKCINGKFYYDGNHVSVLTVLLFIFISAVIFTLKFSSVLMACKLACRIKCQSRCNYQAVPETPYHPQAYVLPVAFEPTEEFQPTSTPMFSHSQVSADEQLARHLQRQYDME